MLSSDTARLPGGGGGALSAGRGGGGDRDVVITEHSPPAGGRRRGDVSRAGRGRGPWGLGRGSFGFNN